MPPSWRRGRTFVGGVGGPPIVWGSSVSFQVGSFLGEAAIIANQSKLLGDLATLASTGRPAVEP